MADMTIPVYGGMFDSTEVTETVGGFPRGNKAVDAAFFAKMVACFYRDGIWGEDSFRLSASGMTLTVAPGIGWIRGHMAWLKESASFLLAAGMTYTVLLRMDGAAGAFSLIASEGHLPGTDTEYTKDLVLGTVTVPANASSISAAMIADSRLDSTKCGVVTSTVEALGTVALAQNAYMLGGIAASDYLRTTGGIMKGSLRAAADATGAQMVRNIGCGTELPETLADGELFVLLSAE